MQIPVPDVDKGAKRGFFRRSPRGRRGRQMQRAEVRGSYHAGGTQTAVALVLAIPCFTIVWAAWQGFGYLTLLAIPFGLLVLWLAARANRRNRAPLVTAWRIRRRRRRRLR